MPVPFLVAGVVVAAAATVATVKGFAGEKNPTSVQGAQEKGEKTIKIDNNGITYSVSFLSDGSDVVYGGREGKIRRWRGNDGQEVGPAMQTGGYILNIAVSTDGRWIVSGTDTGQVTVWNTVTHECVTKIKAHGRRVYAVDVSPDGTRIATGSEDQSASLWSLSTGERVLGPLKHQAWVVAVKYSPRADLLATATWNRKSIRIYNSQNGDLLFDIPMRVSSHINQSLTWSADGREIYALTNDGQIHCLDPSTGASRSCWLIHSSKGPECIALARNGKFIVASANSSISFWDTFTHAQIGRVIEHSDVLWSICLSPDDHSLASGGNGKKITIQSLRNILPRSYLELDVPMNKSKEIIKTEHNISTALPLVQVLDSKIPIESRGSRCAADNVTTGMSETETCSQLADALHTSMDLGVESGKSKSIKSLPAVLPNTNISLELGTDHLSADWGTDLVSSFENIGDTASGADKTEETIAAYSTALSLSPRMRSPILVKWITMILRDRSWATALIAAAEFKFPPFVLYQAVCDVLEETGRTVEATECLQQMKLILGSETSTDSEQARWESEFGRRCASKLECLGDAAMDSRRYSEATKHYSMAHSLDPVNISDILVKRNKVEAWGLWQETLDDVDEAIALAPSSHQGCERSKVALRSVSRRDTEVVLLKAM